MRTGEVYCLVFADGKLYIGASIGGARARYRGHELAVRRGELLPIYAAWRKYGPPKLVVLSKGLKENVLWKEERKAIVKYKTKVPNGYNVCFGLTSVPGALGLKRSDATRQKMRDARQGYRHSKETRELLSIAGIKRFKDPKEREKVRQGNLGKVVSEETRKKSSLALKGKKRTAKTKERMKQAALKRWARERVEL